VKEKDRKDPSLEGQGKLIETLRLRFESNSNRHRAIDWAHVRKRLEANPEKLWSLNEIEITGGEPVVVGYDKDTGEFVFYDCSPESPTGEEAFATTGRPWSRGKETSRPIAPSIWPRKWASRF